MALQNQLVVVDNSQEGAEYEVVCGETMVLRRSEFIERVNRVFVADYTHGECHVKVCPRWARGADVRRSNAAVPAYSLFLFVNANDLVYSYSYTTLQECIKQSFTITQLTDSDALWKYAVSAELPVQWKEFYFDDSAWSWKRGVFPLYQNDAVLYLRKQVDVGAPPVFES